MLCLLPTPPLEGDLPTPPTTDGEQESTDFKMSTEGNNKFNSTEGCPLTPPPSTAASSPATSEMNNPMSPEMELNECSLTLALPPTNGGSVLTNDSSVPSKDSSMPVNDSLLPSKDSSLPSKDSLLPAKDSLVSSKDSSKPLNGNSVSSVPSKEGLLPSNGSSLPSKDSSMSSKDSSLPLKDSPLPLNGDSVPSVPSKGDSMPSKDSLKPSVPSKDSSLPSKDSSLPSKDSSLPSKDSSLPSKDISLTLSVPSLDPLDPSLPFSFSVSDASVPSAPPPHYISWRRLLVKDESSDWNVHFVSPEGRRFVSHEDLKDYLNKEGISESELTFNNKRPLVMLQFCGMRANITDLKRKKGRRRSSVASNKATANTKTEAVLPDLSEISHCHDTTTSNSIDVSQAQEDNNDVLNGEEEAQSNEEQVSQDKEEENKPESATILKQLLSSPVLHSEPKLPSVVVEHSEPLSPKLPSVVVEYSEPLSPKLPSVVVEHSEPLSPKVPPVVVEPHCSPILLGLLKCSSAGSPSKIPPREATIRPLEVIHCPDTEEDVMLPEADLVLPAAVMLPAVLERRRDLCESPQAAFLPPLKRRLIDELASVSSTATSNETLSTAPIGVVSSPRIKLEDVCSIPMVDLFRDSPLHSFLCYGCSQPYTANNGYTVDFKVGQIEVVCGHCSWWTMRKFGSEEVVDQKRKNRKRAFIEEKEQ